MTSGADADGGSNEPERAREAGPAPRPRLSDHLVVVGLLVKTIVAVVPFLLHLLVGPLTTPRARRRLTRRLAEPPPPPDESAAPDPAAWEGKTLFVIAGEASGDRLAARVVEAIRRRAPGIRVRGYGGPALAAAGAALDRLIVEHAVVGVVGVLASLPTWWRLCAETLARFRTERPDVLLTVDFPGLNLRLARWAKRRGIRAVHLVAPQTWAWLPWRTARLRRAVDRLLVTFPFEAAWFRDQRIDTRYVGHPLFEAPLPPPASPDELPESASRGRAAATIDEPETLDVLGSIAPPAPPIVELRPGSRRRDVKRQTRLVLDAAREAGRLVPAARFVVRLASDRARIAFEAAAARAGGLPPRIDVVVGARPDAEKHAVALTTSGTSTAELAVALVPMVVFYRLPWLLRLVHRAYLASPFFAMANVLAGREIVVERLVGGSDGAALGRELAALATDRDRWTATRDALREVRAHVAHPDVADRAARAVLDLRRD